MEEQKSEEEAGNEFAVNIQSGPVINKSETLPNYMSNKNDRHCSGISQPPRVLHLKSNTYSKE